MKFVGVDLTSAFARRPRPVDIAVLDDERAVTFHSANWPQARFVVARDSDVLSHMILDHVARAPGERVVLALDGPQGLAPLGQNMRSCERVLGTQGRTPPQLPPPQEAGRPFQGYIRSSIDLFAALAAAVPCGVLAGTGGVPNTEATLWEVYPGAEWTVFASRQLPKKTSLRGRQERWLLLRQLGVTVPEGEKLPTHDQLDALAGAYLAWCIHHRNTAVDPVVDPVGMAPTKNGETREGYILHATGRIREELPALAAGRIDAEPPPAEAVLVPPAAETVGEDWNDDHCLRVMFTDYSVVHGTEPENAWLVAGRNYLLETAAPDDTLRIDLTYSLTFSGGRGWKASPTVTAILEQLGYPTPKPLGRAQAVSIAVRVLEVVDAALGGFLRDHEAEAAFQTISELISEFFPQRISIEALLQEDPDERGWQRVFITITLPPDYPLDRIDRQHRELDARLMERVPIAKIPLFFIRADLAE